MVPGRKTWPGKLPEAYGIRATWFRGTPEDPRELNRELKRCWKHKRYDRQERMQDGSREQPRGG